jgi:transcriptional regulator with XRE-family HTH domain
MSTPVPTRAHIGRALRRRRQACGMTIEGLAKAAAMHETYLSGIERGQRNPSWQKLLSLATALQTPLSVIVLEAESEASAGPATADKP